MNKELKALEHIYWFIVANGAEDDYKKYYERIKKALKDARNHKEKPKAIVGTITLNEALEQFLIDSCPEVKTKLKALSIIEEKGIDILEFRATKKAKTYNENTKRTYVKDYTDEEYDLLKEVIK